MKEALHDLDDNLIKFICTECQVTKSELFQMDEDTLYDKVYDHMCDIEIEETPSDNSPLTAHCQMAADIVTELGNALAKEQGYLDDDAIQDCL